MSYSHIYPGALHLHSRYSDGTGTIPEIAAAAGRAGLRWIIMTDHNTLAGQPEEGWYGDVAVIVGCEVTPQRNHFLALDLPAVVDEHLPTQEWLDAVYAAGGWGVIAHPDERTDNALKEPYNWTDWAIDGPTSRGAQPVGLELWNWMSDWAEQLTPSTKHRNFFFPRLGIRGPTAATLAWWDRLNATGKRTFGTGNLNSHAAHIQALGRTWEVFPYLYLFRTVTNYLWMETPLAADFATAKRQVLDTLGRGQLWFANRHYGEARHIRFSGQRRGQMLRVGEAATLDGPVVLSAAVDQGAALRLLCDGQEVARGRNTLRYTATAPGAYRLEARRWRQPWLYTNPIYLQG